MPVPNAFELAATKLEAQAQEWDHGLWLRENLPAWFPLPFGVHHEYLLGLLGDRPQGIRSFTGWWRGGGKTTIKMGLGLSCIARGSHTFVVIIAQKTEKAAALLQIIRSELHRRPDLQKKYPNLRIVRHGARAKVDRAKELQLAGGRIVALGVGESPRGFLRESEYGPLLRPDLVFVDDIETEQQARSELLTNRREDYLFKEVAGLVGPGAMRSLDVVATGTTLTQISLAYRAIHRQGRFASWRIEVFPAETTVTREVDGRQITERVATWPEGQPLDFLDQLLDPSSEVYIGSRAYATEYLLNPQSIEGALWKIDAFDKIRVDRELVPQLIRVVVGVDPSGSSKGDEVGIIVGGKGVDGKAYILDDRSGHYSPNGWGTRTVDAYEEHQADRVVGEKNFGGDMVETIIESIARERGIVVAYEGVTASRGKQQRAEPVANLYEQDLVRHVKGLAKLEKEQADWVPGESDFSPGRVDGVVWVLTKLMLDGSGPVKVSTPAGISLPLGIAPRRGL